MAALLFTATALSYSRRRACLSGACGSANTTQITVAGGGRVSAVPYSTVQNSIAVQLLMLYSNMLFTVQYR